MKRTISILLCILLCISFSSAFVWATDMDENELPGAVINPNAPYFGVDYRDICTVALVTADSGDAAVYLEQADAEHPEVYAAELYYPAESDLSFRVLVQDQEGSRWELSSSNLMLGESCTLDRVYGAPWMPLSFEEDCVLVFRVVFDTTSTGKCPTILITKRQEPVPTRSLAVRAPESWQKIYADTEALGAFPGQQMVQQGLVHSVRIGAGAASLVLSTPNEDGTYRQTEEIVLEDNGKDVTIVLEEDGSYEVFYGTAGDVTGDGRRNIGDVARIYAHLRGSLLLTDSNALFHADFTGEGRLNMGDVAKLYSFIKTIPAV